MNSCFQNYVTDTPARKELYELARKFGYAVVNHNQSFPLALIMSGKPGIGKTHLSVAILNLVLGNSDKSIVYIDEKYIRDYSIEFGSGLGPCRRRPS